MYRPKRSVLGDKKIRWRRGCDKISLKSHKGQKSQSDVNKMVSVKVKDGWVDKK